MVVAGFYMVAAGKLTTGALIAATMLAGRALQPLGQIAMLISRLHQTRLAYRALNDIVMLDQERPDGQSLMTSVAMTGALACENLTYRYDPDAPASLDDVSFEVKAGERIGLVGAIGSGKTTLLKIIHAVHLPTLGRVLVDGVPVNQIDPAVLRSGIGLALQGADLFHGTIRSNISLADPGAPDEDILWAARAAGALDWILRLPKGFETPVRERGAGLSGGQRQSVALARALFKRPKIILLDEPTSDMDLGTEQHVVQSLSVAMKGRTVIAVSHRPAILALVDRLIVMDQGRRILDGPKEDVLRKIETMTAARSEQLKQRPSAPRGGAA
jgi:ATP-binding cassette subfamily C protein LapB